MSSPHRSWRAVALRDAGVGVDHAEYCGCVGTRLSVLLDQLETAVGPPDPVPSNDGWELVVAENIGYLVDDERRWRAVSELRKAIGTAPEQILAASDQQLRSVVIGMRPAERAARLRRCAELAIAGAPWRAFAGIGVPGAERIELFTGSRCVLALDSNALRVLVRLGYGDPSSAYATAYRQAQAAAARELPQTIAALQRAHQLLRRHGRTLCRRNAPACLECPLRSQCPSAGRPPPLY
jgi:endonuclease-3